MTEPTPPPERPLPEESRARMRAELLAHAHENRSSAPRWAVPLGAAAAVALVAGLGVWAVSRRWRRAGGSRSPAVAGRRATPTPSVAPSSVASNEGTGTPTPPGFGETVQVGTRSCEAEMENVLKGATLALQVDDTSSFWVKGEKFVLCDELDGRTTVHQALPLTPRDDVSTYAVSTDLLGGQVVRAAGGIVPAGAEDVFDVAYTFPDGHTEHATKATDDQGRTWWLMTYTYDDGGGNELDEAGDRRSPCRCPACGRTTRWRGPPTPAPRPTTAADARASVMLAAGHITGSAGRL